MITTVIIKIRTIITTRQNASVCAHEWQRCVCVRVFMECTYYVYHEVGIAVVVNSFFGFGIHLFDLLKCGLNGRRNGNEAVKTGVFPVIEFTSTVSRVNWRVCVRARSSRGEFRSSRDCVWPPRSRKRDRNFPKNQ